MQYDGKTKVNNIKRNHTNVHKSCGLIIITRMKYIYDFEYNIYKAELFIFF
jgi:hypothetical protein